MTFGNESKKLIKEASEIKASGRWGAMNEIIRHLANNPDGHGAWQIQTLENIYAQNFSEYLSLKAAYETGDKPSLLAWRARNLLEISVWAIYCSTSKENAHNFYIDAGKDVTDIYKAFIKWGENTSQSSDWFIQLEKAKDDVLQDALSESIESLDGAYNRVNDIATKIGLGQHYGTAYKLLSKFCHPTALLVLGNPDIQKEKLQKNIFYYFGCMFFVSGFNALERCLTLMEQENK